MGRKRTFLAAYLAGALAVALALAWAGQSQPARKGPAKKSTVHKKKTSTSAKKTGKSSASRKKVAGPRGQQRPTPERYKQIEEALAARGYLQEEPTGKWSANSVEALRNFQADHELPPTGRIDALSLTQLGLGPPQ